MSRGKWKKKEVAEPEKRVGVVENTPVGGSPTIEGPMSVDKLNRMDAARVAEASKPSTEEPVKNPGVARFKGYGVKIDKIGEKRITIDFSVMKGEWVTSDMELAAALEAKGYERIS